MVIFLGIKTVGQKISDDVILMGVVLFDALSLLIRASHKPKLCFSPEGLVRLSNTPSNNSKLLTCFGFWMGLKQNQKSFVDLLQLTCTSPNGLSFFSDMFFYAHFSLKNWKGKEKSKSKTCIIIIHGSIRVRKQKWKNVCELCIHV